MRKASHKVDWWSPCCFMKEGHIFFSVVIQGILAGSNWWLRLNQYLSGWFWIFSGLRICGTVRTGLACIGCWKFPWLLYHLLCLLDRNNKLREIFWWDYLCKVANININQTDFPPWPLGYKQVEMFWHAKLSWVLMQQIGFLYLLFLFWHWNLQDDNLIDLPYHFSTE